MLKKRALVVLPFGLILPVFVLLVFVVLIPEIWSLVLSFTDYQLGQPLAFVGGSNFLRVFADARFWGDLGRNLTFVVAAVSLQMLLGLSFSLLLARRFVFQRLWVALILAPIVVSPPVAAVMWKYLLNYNIGPINYLLGTLGLGRHMWLSDFHLALASVILVYVWQTIPNVVLILYPARLSLPQSLYEVAAIDGANRWQCFRHVTMPLLRPALYVALIFRIILSFRAFGIIWTLTKGGPVGRTEVLSIYLFREGFKYWRFGTAAAVGWIMLVFTMLVASYQIRSMYKTMFNES